MNTNTNLYSKTKLELTSLLIKQSIGNSTVVDDTRIFVKYLITLNELDGSRSEVAYANIIKELSVKTTPIIQHEQSIEEVFEGLYKELVENPNNEINIRKRTLRRARVVADVNLNSLYKLGNWLFDKELMFELAIVCPNVLEYNIGVFSNKESVANFLKSNLELIENIPERLKDDGELMLGLIKIYPPTLEYIGVKLWNNPAFMRKAIRANYETIKFICGYHVEDGAEFNMSISRQLYIIVSNFGNEMFDCLPENYKTNAVIIALASLGVSLDKHQLEGRIFTYNDILESAKV